MGFWSKDRVHIQVFREVTQHHWVSSWWHTALTFRVKLYKKTAWPWRWGQYAPSKRR